MYVTCRDNVGVCYVTMIATKEFIPQIQGYVFIFPASFSYSNFYFCEMTFYFIFD